MDWAGRPAFGLVTAASLRRPSLSVSVEAEHVCEPSLCEPSQLEPATSNVQNVIGAANVNRRSWPVVT